MSNTLKDFADIIEGSTRGMKIDKSLTLRAWHERAVAVRGAVLQLKSERNAKLKKANDNYKGAALEAAVTAANNEFDTAVRLATEKIEADLESVLKSKRRAWSRANTAPSADMVNMLTALQMRGGDLTAGEIVATVEQLNGNAVAMRTLKSICKRAGLIIPEFIGVDPERFDNDMERAEQYARNGITSLDKDPSELQYLERLFWLKPGEGLDAEYFKPLDSTTLTTAMISKAEPGDSNKGRAGKSTTGTPGPTSGDKWVRLTYQGNASVISLAEQFGVDTKDIEKANPHIDLRHLHAGDKILVPSTRLKNWSGLVDAVNPADVEVIDRPVEEVPEGFGEFQDLAAAQE